MTFVIEHSINNNINLQELSKESVVNSYFEMMNQWRFEEVSILFATSGILAPPFISQQKGREAINNYLHQYAQGIILFPNNRQFQPFPNGQTQIDVYGQVKNFGFEAKVGWTFLLSPKNEINLLQIKLLVSLGEFKKLRHQLDKFACG